MASGIGRFAVATGEMSLADAIAAAREAEDPEDAEAHQLSIPRALA